MSPSVRLPLLAVSCLLLLPLFPRPARGEEDARPVFTEDVVVSANLTDTPLEEAGVSITVIGREEIAARDAGTVAELLRTVPGVAVVAQGGPGRVTSVFVRGGSSSQTLVLLDGVRVNAVGSAAFDFADLSTENVERIEVLRGPQSSLYGSEAMGGVINIVTRRGGEGLAGTLRAEAGADDAYRLHGAAAGGGERFDWRVAAGDERLPGYSLAAASRGDETFNPYRNTSAAAKAGARVGRAGRLETSLHYTDSDTHPDSFEFPAGPVAAPLYAQRREGLVAGAVLRAPVNERWTQSVRAGYASEDLVGSNPGNAFGFDDYDITSRALSAGVQSDVRVGRGHLLSAGASWERRDGENRGLFGGYDESEEILALYAQDQWSWNERVHLTGALRRDDHSVFGAETTWRATAGVRAAAATRLRASWGTGFKAPTFVDLFFPGYGNPALRPETSEGWDAGVSHSFAGGRVIVDAAYFETRFDDLIVAEAPTFVANNVESARADGVEASLTWTAARALALSAAYTYTDSEDEATGRQLARRPRHHAALTAHLRPGARLGVLFSYVLDTDRVDVGGAPLDDIRRLDGALQYRLSQTVSLTARGRNLLDDDAQETPGYRTPGRLVAAGVALTF